MKRSFWIATALLLLIATAFAACGTPEVVVETREVVVTQVVEIEGETVIETRVVQEEVVVTATPEPTASPYDPDAPIKVMADTTRAPAIQLFMETYPEYADKIQLMTDDRGVFHTKLLLYNNVGSGWPDVIFHEVEALRLANTAQYDYYPADLSLWVPQEIVDEFYPGANANCLTPDGKLICLRNDIAPNILYFNVPKFEEFGYTVPTTWEEFMALAETVAAEHPGYVMGELDNWATEKVWYIGSECPMMNPVSDTKFRVNFLHPNCQRVSKMLDDLNALGVLDTNGTFSAALAEKWKAGEWLTWIGPVWEADFVIKGVYLDPEDPANEGIVGMAAVPKWEDQSQVWTASVGGAAWSMSRHTVNPELAAKLIVFVTTHPSVTESAVTLSAYRPGGDAWAEALAGRSPLLAKDPDPYEVINFMASKIWPDYKEGPPVVAAVGSPLFTEVQGGNKTAQEIAEELQTALVELTEQAGFEVEQTGP